MNSLFQNWKSKFSFPNLILFKMYHKRQFLTIRNRKRNTKETQGNANQGQVPHGQLLIFHFVRFYLL